MQPIRVANIREGSCRKDKLKLYFQNRTKSGGGIVHNIEIVAEDEAIITFQEVEGVFMHVW